MLRSLTVWLLTSAIAASPALAQVAPHLSVPDASQILAPPAVPPAARVAPPPTPEVALPQTGAAKLSFTHVRVVGATLVPEAALAAVFAPGENHPITATDLKPLLDAADALYKSAGYPLGRVYVPAQAIQGGLLTVQVVEGYVGTVAVSADNPKTKALVERFASRLVGVKPLTDKALQRVMLLVQNLPGITVGSAFRDMDPASGATTLVIQAAVRTTTLGLSMDNRANLQGLPFQPYLGATFSDLMGEGDQLSLTALLSTRQKDYAFYSAGYSQMVGDDGLNMGISGSFAQILDDRSLPPYDIRSQSSQLATDVRYPLLLGTNETLNASGRFYYTHTAYSVLSTRFAHDNFLALSAGGDYTRALTDAELGALGLGATLQVTHGLAALSSGPTTRGGAQSDFTKVRGEARFVYKPDDAISIIFKTIGQYGSGSLYASEEIAFGGPQYGRGFDSAEMSGDSGFGFSVQPEYAIPFAVGSGMWGQGWSVTPYALFDYAKAYNTPGDFQPKAELVSAGGGLRLGVSSLFTVTVEVDKPLNRAPLYRTDRNARVYGGLEFGLNQALALIGGIP